TILGTTSPSARTTVRRRAMHARLSRREATIAWGYDSYAFRGVVPSGVRASPMRPDDPNLCPTAVTIRCVDFEAVPRDKAATLAKMEVFIADAAAHGCDLVIFPELALNTWGACADCADLHRPCEWHRAQAEAADGPAFRAVLTMAAAHDIHVI